MRNSRLGPLFVALWIVIAGLGAAARAEPFTPQPGTAERRALLDTLRPVASDGLGAPIEFVVRHLVVDGDHALALLHAQRPGGEQIDLAETPLHLRDGVPVSLIDGPMLIAFLSRQSGVWQVGEFCIGCTDAWWVGLDCPNHGDIYAAMYPDAQICPR